MLFSPPPRDLQIELLDADEAPYPEVRESLNDVRKVNKYLSGYRVLLQHLGTFLKEHDPSRPFTILDLATGSADQPGAMARFARRKSIPARITAIDINRKMLRFAREETRRFPEISLVQCDINSLPFRENSFDLVTNNLSLHHFTRRQATEIIRSAHRIGRRGFIINDLHRSRVAYYSIYLLTRLLTQNRITRYDAPVSVMNAFLPTELDEMTREAGVEQFKIFRHFPYRLAIVGTKPA